MITIDHVKDQLCQRIEELESKKMELNEQLDALQEERDSYQREFAQATEVLGEIHEALNGSGPAIVGMEAAQVRQLKGERDALAAQVKRLEDIIERSTLADSPAAESALEDTPETSLARLKALWLAEGVQRAADLIRYDYEGHVHQDRIADYVDDVALELRHQAEGGEA